MTAPTPTPTPTPATYTPEAARARWELLKKDFELETGFMVTYDLALPSAILLMGLQALGIDTSQSKIVFNAETLKVEEKLVKKEADA